MFFISVVGGSVSERKAEGAKVTVEIEGYSGAAGVQHRCKHCISADDAHHKEDTSINTEQELEPAGLKAFPSWSWGNARKAFFFFKAAKFTNKCTKESNRMFIKRTDCIHIWYV